MARQEGLDVLTDSKSRCLPARGRGADVYTAAFRTQLLAITAGSPIVGEGGQTH
jgi:hypothetical protein